MIQPISNSTYPVFKNKENPIDTNKYNYFGRKAVKDINTEQDYQRKVVEQNERLITILGIGTIVLMGTTFLLNLKAILELIRKKRLSTSAFIREFESLKSNSKVPTLENCKSINKDLKRVLERQVNNIKAGNDILSTTGEPQAQNRMLLYGPPGVGKSFFGKIFAKSLDAEYMEVMQSDYNSMWAGEGVNNLKKVFEGILDSTKNNPEKRYVVVFNEIDSMVAPSDNITRNTKGTHWVSILEERSVFLNYLEILKEKAPNVTIIGTTNISPKNNGLDRAAMSRLQNLIEIPYPETDCLYEALKMSLEKIKNKDKFLAENDKNLKNLAQQMSDRKFSFRNLEYVVNDALGYHLDDSVAGKKGEFKFEYLQKAEKNLKISDGELDSTTK